MLALNNIKKKMASIIIMMILFLNILGIKSFALVEPTYDFYVNDYADLLSSDVEQYIISTNKTLNSQTGAQIVVVTVQNLEGQSLEEYSTELFRKFGIGDKTKNNGVLMLLALEERQMRIEVGYGLEGVLTDGKTGRIQDEYIIPYLKENNWNEGIRNGYSKILEEVANEYQVDVGEINAVSQGKGIFELILQNILGVIFTGAIVCMFINRKVKIGLIICDIISIVVLIIVQGFINTEIISTILMIQWILLCILFISLFRGTSSGGGFHGGGRRILRWRRIFWWFIRRRRLIWWRRIFKKFLEKILVNYNWNLVKITRFFSMKNCKNYAC